MTDTQLRCALFFQSGETCACNILKAMPAHTMKLELLPVSVPRPLKRKQQLIGRPQKNVVAKPSVTTPSVTKTSVSILKGCDYPQSDDSDFSCSNSTDSGCHDSDPDTDFEHAYVVDCQWDHHNLQCDFTEMEHHEESYVEFDHDHNEAFAEVVEALSDDL